MNALNQNRQSGIGKALGAWLGCAALFTGLALPAYGQGITSPADCSNLNNGATPSVPSVAPKATGTGGDPAGTDASSFAAGCDAEANTDGSIAIGDNAKVEAYTTAIPGGVSGTLTTTTTNPDGKGVHTNLSVVRRADGDYYGEASPGSGFTVKLDLPSSVANTGFVRTIDFTEMGVAPTTAPAGVDSIAIGSRSSVTGNSSIAIGAGSTVGTAAGADPAVANNNGVAIGAGASVTGDNGIAIGAGVTAGENQIVIGSAGQSAVIGGVDLAGIATNTATGIANTAGIATNTATGIANTAGIATNTATGIANTAGIATNKTAIDTNRSGIAMSVALAHLPTIKGGGWGIAAGTFDSETAIAVGAHFNVQQNAFIKIGAASSGGETSFGLGYGKGF